ncbi:MAG: hypothetical protein R3A44_07655 [Caldilineaceae bacterium]
MNRASTTPSAARHPVHYVFTRRVPPYGDAKRNTTPTHFVHGKPISAAPGALAQNERDGLGG